MRSAAGASLAEVLVAVVLLATGALAAAGLMAHGARLVGDGRESGQRSRIVAEIHDSLVASEWVAAGEREVAGDTVRWEPAPGVDGENGALLVVPGGRGGDADTLWLPAMEGP